MAYQGAIINIINTQLQANVLCDARFEGAQINGIAYDTFRNFGGEKKIFPSTQDLTGEGTMITPDDTFPLQLWHRIKNKTYKVLSTSVGDRNNKVRETTDVILVVAGFTDPLQLTQEDCEALFISNFPDVIKASLISSLKIESLNILLQSSDMDKQSVFKSQFMGQDYSIKPEQILFSIKYQIESTYKKGCFIITDCQPTGVLNQTD